MSKKELEKSKIHLEIASKISTIMIEEDSIDDILQNSINTIVNELKLLGGIILLPKEDFLYSHSISQSNTAKEFMKVVKLPLNSLKVNLNNTDNLIVDTYINRKINQSFKLYDFTKGPLNYKLSTLAKLVTNTNSAISLPLIFNNEKLGVLYLANNEKDDFKELIQLLKIIASHLSIVISNSNLHRELKDEKKQLEYTISEIKKIRENEEENLEILTHDIKNPIASLSGAVELLKETDSRLKSIMTRSLDQITEILKKLSQNPDNYSDELNIDEFSIKEFMDEIYNQFSIVATNKNLKIKYHCESGEIYTDKGKLYEIVSNLLTNSIKYTNNGEITFKVENIEISRDISILVKDTGIGIHAKDLDKIGNKFFRSYRSLIKLDDKNDEITGSGLGLYIVKKFVDELGGKFHIKSEVSKGTEIKVIIPNYQLPDNQIL